MPENDPTAALARQLLDGITALRAGKPLDAISPLQAVAGSEALAGASDLQDIRARACTLLAQALLEAQRPEDAKPWLDEAQGLAQSQGDADGLAAIGELRKQHESMRMDALRKASAAARLSALADTPLDAIRAQHAKDPAALAEALLRKANAEIEVGRPELAIAPAKEALQLAKATWSVRAEVMAHLSLARAAPQSAHASLTAAWRAAEGANEHTLVTAVAKAAEVAGIELTEASAPFAGKDPS